MAALFYKDCYMIYKYYRMLMVMVVVFLVSLGMNGSMFFAVYPAIVMTAMSLSTLSYDERSRWLQYADTMPYGRKKIVGSKYLLAGVGCLAAMALAAGIELCVGLAQRNADWYVNLAGMLGMMLLVGTIHTAVVLPISFKFGTERGRFIYIICIAVFSALAYAWPMPGAVWHGGLWLSVGLLAVGCGALWVISYWISVRLFQSREL